MSSHLSYSGQSEVDYCVECSIKHGQTAKVLMREGIQRAEADNPAVEGVKEKIRGVIEELSGFEDDTETVQNENVTALNTIARDLRKFIYSSKAEIGGADIETLREIKSRVDNLVDQAYLVREQEEICVPCVSPVVCRGNVECIEFLEEVAELGDKTKFQEAVEEAKEKFTEVEGEKETDKTEFTDYIEQMKRQEEEEKVHAREKRLESYGKSVADKRKQFLEEISSAVQ